MYLIVWLMFTVWASITWGMWGGIITFLIFFIVPPIIIACTLGYMEKNKIERYRLDLIIISFDLERDHKQ